MKFAIIANVLIKTIFIVCVTILAITFNNANLLWWLILIPLLGFSYSENEKHSTDEGGDNNG